MQQEYLSGDVAERGLVAADHAGEDVIDDHRRDGGEQADGRRQQRFRDARRHHRKVGGLGPMIWPSGNFAEDMKKMARFYSNVTPRFPENATDYRALAGDGE